MKKGTVLLAVAMTVIFTLPLLGLSRFEKSALEKQKKAANIVYLSHEPLQFGLRKGGTGEDWPERYEKQHAAENFRLMASLGSRYGRLHFHKGFGLQFEMPEIRRTMQAARIMHDLGMKVSVYVGGSMFIETFYRETPEAVNWEQRDQYGRPVPYLVGTQTFRHMPCPNSRGYRNYIKKVLDVGIDSVKTDQFFFDNYFLRAEPKSCRCERCIEAFKTFLKRKYPTEKDVRERFGYPSVDWIKVNEWDKFNRPEDVESVNDPVLQEWVRFRCESLAGQCREFYEHIKGRNPSISVGFNLKGLYSLNRIWYNAVYHPLFAGLCDFFCFDIGGMQPGLDPETGALVSEIRSYKIARRLDMACSHGAGGIQMAEQMAFNNQKYLEGFGYHGAGYNHYAQRVFTPLAEFFREYNDRYYTETDNVADCAVFRSWPSMAYSVSSTWIPTVLAEQVLILHKVPFDIIFDQHIDQIGRYQAIILPGQESLSAENIERLTDFVRAGGTLVFTGNTADYNGYRARRRVNPLLALMKLDRRPAVISVRRLGKGKLVYIPEIVPGMEITPQGRWAFPSSQWVLPPNHEEIINAITRHLPEGPSLRAEVPLTTVAEILNREKSRETIVHFVNYEQGKKLDPFRVELKPQFKGRVSKVEMFVPEFDQPGKLEFSMEEGKLVFTVPEMGMYSMIVVSYGS